jgi:hypothetical protein
MDKVQNLSNSELCIGFSHIFGCFSKVFSNWSCVLFALQASYSADTDNVMQ